VKAAGAVQVLERRLDMDRQKAKLIGDAVEEALKSVETKYGVKLSHTRGRYGSDSLRMTLEFREPSDSGEFVDPAAKRLDDSAEFYGLPKDIRGKTFIDRGHKYTVVGLAERSSRFPVLVDRDDERKFRYSIEIVKALVKA
jgi:hypothetical protein